MSTASTHILRDAASRHKVRSWLILGGEAALAVGIATDHPDATVRWQPIDCRELVDGANRLGNLHVEPPGANDRPVGGVVIAATPNRDLARRWLLMSRQVLATGGRLFIAGANIEGIRPVIGDAAKLFGPAVREDYRSRQRVAEFANGAIDNDLPAWASKPGVEPGTWEQFSLDISGNSIAMVTQAGVFAGDRVDAGTRLLLDTLPDRLSGRVLDVGCGAGAIGIAASLRGAEAVEVTDVNLLAIQAAQENIRRHGLTGCTAFASDVYEEIGNAWYELIVSNPPFHRGKAIDRSIADRLIDEAPDHLETGGSLLVVANAFLAYGKHMERVFSCVETVAATRQYHVLRASEPR